MSNPNLLTALHAKNLHPSTTWLSDFLNSSRPSIPLAALTSTATFRLLASDITTTFSHSSLITFPPASLDVNIREKVLQSSVIVQIRDVIEISRSRYEVLEGLEMESRGEMTKGREVIQITPVAVDSDDAIPTAITAASTSSTQQSRKTGTHKLLLQDSAGLIIWGLELTSIEGIKEDEIIIGKKLCLKEGTMVARGVVLLEDEKVILMGGKVEEWQRKWKGGRMERLRRELGIEG